MGCGPYRLSDDSQEINIRFISKFGAEKLLKIRCVFSDPPNPGSVKDFISYMGQIKSISHIYNAAYVTDMSTRPVDTASTIDEARNIETKLLIE